MAWVAGVAAEGRQTGLHYDNPPSGWLQDPFGGAWYPRTDAYVQSGWGRGAPIDLQRPADDSPPVEPVGGWDSDDGTFPPDGADVPDGASPGVSPTVIVAAGLVAVLLLGRR